MSFNCKYISTTFSGGMWSLRSLFSLCPSTIILLVTILPLLLLFSRSTLYQVSHSPFYAIASDFSFWSSFTDFLIPLEPAVSPPASFSFWMPTYSLELHPWRLYHTQMILRPYPQPIPLLQCLCAAFLGQAFESHEWTPLPGTKHYLVIILILIHPLQKHTKNLTVSFNRQTGPLGPLGSYSCFYVPWVLVQHFSIQRQE